MAETVHQRPPEDRETARSIDTTGRYLRTIGAVALLTADEEIELAKTVEAGVYAQAILDGQPTTSDASREELARLAGDGQLAFDRMLVANLRLVVNLTRRQQESPVLQRDDYYQEGSFGLVRAIERFDYRREKRLSTTATLHVRHDLVRARQNYQEIVRLPVHVQEQRYAVEQATKELRSEHGHDPRDSELADRLGWPLSQLMAVRRLTQPTLQLDLPPGSGDASLSELLVDEEDADFREYFTREGKAELRRVLDELLDNREYEVVRLRYGFDGQMALQSPEIGRRLGIRGARVRQIEARAMAKLRRHYETAGLTFNDLAA